MPATSHHGCVQLLHGGEALVSTGARRVELEAPPGVALKSSQLRAVTRLGRPSPRSDTRELESTKPKGLAQIWCVSYCSPGHGSIPSSWLEGTSQWKMC